MVTEAQRAEAYQRLGLSREVIYETSQVSVAICTVEGSGGRGGCHKCAGKVVPTDRGAEAQVLAELNAMAQGFGDHPHLVAPVCVKMDEEGRAVLAYPHAGKDLRHLQRGLAKAKRKGLIATVNKGVVRTMFDSLQSLKPIHDEGYVHGDVKSLNFLRKDGFTRAADFGLCGPANSPIKGHSLCNPVADYFVRLPSGRRVINSAKACAEAHTWHTDVHAVGFMGLELLGAEPSWLNTGSIDTTCFGAGFFSQASPEEAWAVLQEVMMDNAAMMLDTNLWPKYLAARVEHEGLRDLLGHMLCPREERWTVEQLLGHPVFAEVARDYPARLAKVQPRWEEDRRSAAIAAESFLSAECRVRGLQLQQQLDAADSHQQHHEIESGEEGGGDDDDEECEENGEEEEGEDYHERQPAAAAQQVAATATAVPATPAAVIKRLMDEHAARQQQLTELRARQQQLPQSTFNSRVEAACLQQAIQQLVQKYEEVEQQWQAQMQQGSAASNRSCRPQEQATSSAPSTGLQHQQHTATPAPAPTVIDILSCASSSAGIPADVKWDQDLTCLVEMIDLTTASQQAMQAKFLAKKIQLARNAVAAAEPFVHQLELELAAQQQVNLHDWEQLMRLRQQTFTQVRKLYDLQRGLACEQQQEQQHKQSSLTAQSLEHEQQLAALQAQLAEAQQQLDTASAAAATRLAASQQKDAELLATRAELQAIKQQVHQQGQAMSQLAAQLGASDEQLKLAQQHKIDLQLQLTAAREAAERCKSVDGCVPHSLSFDDDDGITPRGASQTLQLLSPGFRDSSSSDSGSTDMAGSSTDDSSNSSSGLTIDDDCDAVVRVVVRVPAGSSNTNKAAPVSQSAAESAKALPCSRELPKSCFTGDDDDVISATAELAATIAPSNGGCRASVPTGPKLWMRLRGCVVCAVRKLMH